MRIYVRKDALGVLRPADRQAREALKRYKQDDVLSVDLKRPRNGRFHRKLWALLEVTMLHLPESMESKFPTAERLLWELKCQTGRFDVHTTLGGRETVIPHSISFAKMDEDEFGVFYSECVEVICKHILPGVSNDQLRASAEEEIRDFLG